MHTVLVVGASGFLGSHVVEELASTYRVVACCRLGSTTSRLGRISHPIEVVPCSTEEMPNLVGRVGADVVINAAVAYGRDESIVETLGTNTLLPVTLAEALLSTPEALFIHTDTFFSKTSASSDYLQVYRETKRASVALLAMLGARLRVVNMRLEHLYGPTDSPSKFVPYIIKQLVSGVSPIALTNGTQFRDFIHVRDAARAFRAVIEHRSSISPGFTSIDVGTGVPVSIRELVESIRSLVGNSSELHFGQLPERVEEIPFSAADPEALSRFGWAPQVDLCTGLQELIVLEKSSKNPS